MPDRLRFVAPLLIVLALLSWGTAHLVSSTSRQWFEKDVRLRSELVINGVHDALTASWKGGDAEGIRRLLSTISRDDRIMGASACDPSLNAIVSTSEYPRELSCVSLGRNVRDASGSVPSQWRSWNQVVSLPGGSVHVSAIPIIEDGQALGFVVLVHDLSFIDRRGATAQRFTLLAFGVLALIASIVTLVVGRAFWRTWTSEARRMLRGGAHRPEFRPFLGDLRDLIAQVAAADDDGETTRRWTPGRLKSALKRYLHGEKVVIVANREPYIHEWAANGDVRIIHPASGLVTALEPVMRACSGVWVAHGSGSADREQVDGHDRLWVPPEAKEYQIRRVWLSDEEEKGYYYGFANEGLWPLCHIAHTRPSFRGADWAHYQRVNRRFAEAACNEADSDDPIILVQDYHLALVPRMIRERLPRATILTFWHVPWPNAEHFGICPWHEEVLEGLLGSSIVGFHTQSHCNNFLETVDRYLEARIDREQFGIVHGKRTTLVRPYPISIEWPNRWCAESLPTEDCRSSVRAELGLRSDVLVGLGVDRLDYTKGVEERLLAVERLLERFTELRGRFTFVQLAAPSRTVIERYRQLNERVDQVAARVNERFGHEAYQPIILLRAHHEPPTVFRYYRAADVCYVSSLHDGMNLVAKEFIAARDDERGVLVLSHFTGAARELTEALIVNPYDLDRASTALAMALAMPADEQRDRMRSMRSLVSEFNVYRWAGRMLVDAARVRSRDRLTDRLSGLPPRARLGSV